MISFASVTRASKKHGCHCLGLKGLDFLARLAGRFLKSGILEVERPTDLYRSTGELQQSGVNGTDLPPPYTQKHRGCSQKVDHPSFPPKSAGPQCPQRSARYSVGASSSSSVADSTKGNR